MINKSTIDAEREIYELPNSRVHIMISLIQEEVILTANPSSNINPN